MKRENEYIGDDKFKKFLEHYSCPLPLSVVKLRFIGAICSPNVDLRPAEVIASLWPENKTPRLETKNEADLFFKFFMGLWDAMFRDVAAEKFCLPRISLQDDLTEICNLRFNELENGFVEGFWGGRSDAKIPAYLAEVIDSLSELAQTYGVLATKINPQKKNKAVFDAVIECDKMATKSICFIIKQYAAPRIESAKATIN
jgi:hypothetical protein